MGFSRQLMLSLTTYLIRNKLQGRKRFPLVLMLEPTFRCNLACIGCGRIREYQDILDVMLSVGECLTAVEESGAPMVSITGGEPLLYPHLENLIIFLRSLSDLRELTLTTNGILLPDKSVMLRRAGIDRVNVSLEAASDEIYRQITGKPCLPTVLKGMDALLSAGFPKPKLNMVLCRQFNTTELRQLLDIGHRYAFELRFIELMGHDQHDYPNASGIVAAFQTIAPLSPIPPNGTAVRRYAIQGYDVILGLIPSRTEPFCNDCSRIRLTSDGQLRTCLFSREGIALHPLLRRNCSEEELEKSISQSIMTKPPRAVGKQICMRCIGG